ncbi:hypothetical protein PROFUN_05437 [Planoprotostelium fungivorum]|uniref:SET domain-containing protein n=1 Tax=Planoprotostelium fungivorum TaxID=1890364 RepID=A0A2P6NQP9_9EUKA|nr:hypothetical protein PROFUN_05437 [Planoprotostelium fungivorum]
MQYAPLSEAFQTYYANAITAQNVPGEVRYIDDAKGKGMFCTRQTPAETVIIKEAPLVSLQHAENRPSAWTCGHCLSFLGSLETQLARHQQVLGQMGQSQPTPQVSLLSAGNVETFECAMGCGEMYCSDACRAEAFQRHHRFLCVGQLTSQNHPLFKFKQQAMRDHEIFLLGAQAICVIIGRWETNGGDFTDAILPFAVYPKKAWWDVACIDSGVPAQVLMGMAEVSLQLLKQALSPHIIEHPIYQRQLKEAGKEPEISTVFNLQFFGLLVGLFELNNQGIEIQKMPEMAEPQKSQIWAVLAPTVEHIMRMQDEMDADDHDHDHDGEDHHCDDEDGGKEEEMESAPLSLFERALQQPYVFPPMQGMGVFVVSATMNHSCEPNTIVRYKDNFLAHVHTTRDIHPGEEMTHSYIEDTMSLEDRNADLQAYGFECDCPKCERERR